MKKTIAGALVLMFLLTGTTVFAQLSDDDFVDTSDTPPIETYLGFAFNIDLQKKKIEVRDPDDDSLLSSKNEQTTTLIPAIQLGARQYWLDIGDTGMQVGYSVLASVGFIGEMELPWGYTAKAEDATMMLNIGGLLGGSIRGDIGDAGLGFVADFGVAFNANLVNYTYEWQGYYYKYKDEYEVQIMAIGLGLNAGLQYRLPLNDSYRLIFELGANLGFTFWSEVKYTRNYYRDDQKIEALSGEITWPIKQEPIIRISPYLMVGVNF